MVTTRQNNINLEQEISKLEAELRLYKELKLTRIERRINELLDALDDPATPQTKGQRLRERLGIIAATVALTAIAQSKFDIPLVFQQPAKQEHVTPKVTSSSAPSLVKPWPTTAPPVDKPVVLPERLPVNLQPSTQLQNLEEAQALFTSHKSLGPKAICEAEGNCSNGQKMKIYYGHTDPGNFVRNYGWCSDQSKGGGTPEGGDKYCLQMVQGRLKKIWADFQVAGYLPTPEEFINAADLYNQAAPEVSRQFPHKLREYKEKGQTGIEAIANSRVASFYFNGRNTADGLLGICRREGRGHSDWDCVLGDQMRRVKAINSVITGFKPSVLDKTRQLINTWSAEFQKDPVTGDIIAGFEVTSPKGWRVNPVTGTKLMHQGVDTAMPTGTPLHAIADGQVEYGHNEIAGLYASFTSDKFPGLAFKLVHLSKGLDKPGTKREVHQGEVIGWSGGEKGNPNSGRSTGSHLHLGIKGLESGNWLRVRRGWLHWFITGEKP